MWKLAWPTHMLSTRDLPQNKRPTQSENEVLEKKIPHKRTRKESRGRNTHISLNRIQKRAMKRDPEGHYIIIKGIIHQENINIVNIYAPNIGAPKHYGKSWRTSRKILSAALLLLPHCQTWIDLPNKISTKILWHWTMP